MNQSIQDIIKNFQQDSVEIINKGIANGRDIAIYHKRIQKLNQVKIIVVE